MMLRKISAVTIITFLLWTVVSMPETPDFIKVMRSIVSGGFGGLIAIFFVGIAQPLDSKGHASNSLKNISNFADFFGLELRKRIKAVAGDFEVEIQRLHKEKRFRTAKWNKALAWSYAFWYVIRGPIDWLAEAVIKPWKGL